MPRLLSILIASLFAVSTALAASHAGAPIPAASEATAKADEAAAKKAALIRSIVADMKRNDKRAADDRARYELAAEKKAAEKKAAEEKAAEEKAAEKKAAEEKAAADKRYQKWPVCKKECSRKEAICIKKGPGYMAYELDSPEYTEKVRAACDRDSTRCMSACLS